MTYEQVQQLGRQARAHGSHGSIWEYFMGELHLMISGKILNVEPTAVKVNVPTQMISSGNYPDSAPRFAHMEIYVPVAGWEHEPDCKCGSCQAR